MSVCLGIAEVNLIFCKKLFAQFSTSIPTQTSESVIFIFDSFGGRDSSDPITGISYMMESD